MARNTLKNVCRLIDVANTKVEPEQAFLSDLKRSIEINAQKGFRKPSQSYKPSSMNCIRNMWYQMSGVDPDDSLTGYSSIGITWSGTDIHERIQAAVCEMKKAGIDCEYIDVEQWIKYKGLDYLTVVSKNGYETKLFHTKLRMSFMCDGIICYKGQYYILEIKTEAAFKFQRREGIDEKHYNQGISYSVALQIPRVIFLYVNRDIFDMKTYMFRPTDEQKSDLVGLITDCDGYVERKICPPKPDIPKRICEYCAYKNRCKGEI